MFAETLNELNFQLTLTPQGPVLVKAGEEPAPESDFQSMWDQTPQAQMEHFQRRKELERKRSEELKQKSRDRREKERKAFQTARRDKAPRPLVEDPESADMRFVLSWRNGRQAPYLPGSSLKGVLRSQAERLARSMSPADGVACNPFGRLDDDDAANRPCWHVFGDPEASHQKGAPAYEVYPRLCPICRLFGSPFLAGRLRISDAYLVETPPPDRLPRRDGVGINRWRGAAQEGAKYDFEYWDGGAFQATVTVRNFELWQLGLLAHLVYAMQQGEIPIGFGVRRGLGRVKAAVSSLHMVYCGGLALSERGPALRVLGMGQLTASRPELARYGFLAQDAPAPLSQGVRMLTTDAITWRRVWEIEEADLLWDQVGPLWNQALEAGLVQAPAAMQGEVTHG